MWQYSQKVNTIEALCGVKPASDYQRGNLKRQLLYERELVNEVCEQNERRKHAGERLMTVW